MAILDQNSLQVSELTNQTVPDEGPKAIPLLLNFANAGEFDLDLQNLQSRAFISMIQTVYVDASAATDDLTIIFNSTNQNVMAKAGTQGYYSVLCPNPPKIRFLNTSGSDVIPVFLINVPVAGVVWNT
jgi:hypothetical protein